MGGGIKVLIGIRFVLNGVGDIDGIVWGCVCKMHECVYGKE
jgi:hypothetical protein